jgi:hypothetical protein
LTVHEACIKPGRPKVSVLQGYKSRGEHCIEITDSVNQLPNACLRARQRGASYAKTSQRKPLCDLTAILMFNLLVFHDFSSTLDLKLAATVLFLDISKYPGQLGFYGYPLSPTSFGSCALGSITGTSSSLRIKARSLTQSPIGSPLLIILTSGFVARKLMNVPPVGPTPKV